MELANMELQLGVSALVLRLDQDPLAVWIADGARPFGQATIWICGSSCRWQHSQGLEARGTHGHAVTDVM